MLARAAVGAAPNASGEQVLTMAATVENETLKSTRVDQVGSLVPDAHWREVVERHEHGEATVEEVSEAQDAAVRAVISKQEAIGLPVITDGELRRERFSESFGASASGFDVPAEVRRVYRASEEIRPFQRAEQDFEAIGPAIYARRPVVERLKLVRNVPLEEYSMASRKSPSSRSR